jgi:N-acetylglucosaminyldiphosphoundecaprenol N-acetyl-beta-D-mannosaminyltransferase
VTERTNIFDRSTNLVETRDFGSVVLNLAAKTGQSVFFCNVHMLMLSQEDRTLAAAMDKAEWVFADGVPVSWLQSRVSEKSAQVVRGYELTLAICEHAAKTGEKIGFMGSTDEVIKGLVKNLHERFEGLNIVYQYCPPFMENELTSTQEELQNIRDSQLRWLFVGLGCPKQEKWIASYKDELNCNILGVGAAFDWLSGHVKMPPHWMESSGLGWLYRLLNNPLKMWRRYFIYSSKFIFRVIKMSVGRE